MHLIELRSGREGHPTYRAVAQAMHERIAAIHPGVAAAMSFVDNSQEPRLERILSEIRTHRKRARCRAVSVGVPLNFFGVTKSASRGRTGEKVQDAPPLPRLLGIGSSLRFLVLLGLAGFGRILWFLKL